MNRISQVLLSNLVFLLLMGMVALAQGPEYTISRWTFASGSSHSGGDYQLYGLAGQADAGSSLSGEGFTLRGGLRPGRGSPPSSPPQQEKIYLPIVVRSP